MHPSNIIILYPLTPNFTFTNITWCKWKRGLQNGENIKLAIMPILPLLCVGEKLECFSDWVFLSVYSCIFFKLENLCGQYLTHDIDTKMFQKQSRPLANRMLQMYLKYFKIKSTNLKNTNLKTANTHIVNVNKQN